MIDGEGAPARLDDTPRRTQPIDLDAFVNANLGGIVAALSILLLLSIVALIVQARRVSRLQRRLDRLTRGASAHDLEDVIGAHLDKVIQVAGEVDSLAARTSALEVSARHAFQRIGLVRFNPFEDTGGNQSFALALLDAEDHGVIVSSLHARAGTRLYAKAISRGRVEAALSEEEARALELARGSSMGRAGLADRTGAAGTRAVMGSTSTFEAEAGGQPAMAELPTPPTKSSV